MAFDGKHVHLEITVEEIDHGTLDRFAAELADGLRRCRQTGPASAEADPPTLVVDLTNVTFLDSGGIRALIEAEQAATRHGGRVVVSGAGGMVRRTLEITGVLERFTAEATGAGVR